MNVKIADFPEPHTCHTYIVGKITSHSYMGKVYEDADGSVFLFGKIVNKIAPGLSIDIGDTLEITKDNNHFTIGIQLIKKKGE